MLLVVSVEGGPGTLQTILDSLRHSTPVVLVVGFGRVTDALAFALERSDAPTAVALEGTSSTYASAPPRPALYQYFTSLLSSRTMGGGGVRCSYSTVQVNVNRRRTRAQFSSSLESESSPLSSSHSTEVESTSFDRVSISVLLSCNVIDLESLSKQTLCKLLRVQ